jgi:hypothetical protein
LPSRHIHPSRNTRPRPPGESRSSSLSQFNGRPTLCVQRAAEPHS